MSAQKKPLPHGVMHAAFVIGIQEKAEHFKKTGTDITMYCHFISVMVGDRPVKLQYCTENPKFEMFGVNDEIVYTTNKYVEKFDRYTLVSAEVKTSSDEKLAKRTPPKGIDPSDDVLPVNQDIDAAEGREFGDAHARSRAVLEDNLRTSRPPVFQHDSKQSPTTTITKLENLTAAQQMMAQAQRNAALFFQMLGNVQQAEFLQFSEALFNQIKNAK